MAFGWGMGGQGGGGGYGGQPWMGSRAAGEGLAYGPAMGHPPMSVGQAPPMNPAMQPGMMPGPGNPGMQGGGGNQIPNSLPAPMLGPQAPQPNPIQQHEMPPPGAPAAPPGQPGMSPGMLGMGLLGAQLLSHSRPQQGGRGGLLDSMGGMQGLLAMQQMMRPGGMGGPMGQLPPQLGAPSGPYGMMAGPR